MSSSQPVARYRFRSSRRPSGSSSSSYEYHDEDQRSLASSSTVTASGRSTTDDLLDTFVREPNPEDWNLAQYHTIALPHRPINLALMGGPTALTRSAHKWQRHKTWPALGWMTLGLPPFFIATHGIVLLTAPFALLYVTLNKKENPLPSDAQVRIDMMVRSLTSMREEARRLCREVYQSASESPSRATATENIATAWLSEALDAVARLEAAVSSSDIPRITCSFMLEKQLKRTRKVLMAGQSSIGRLASQSRPKSLLKLPKERIWLRLDSFPRSKSLIPFSRQPR